MKNKWEEADRIFSLYIRTRDEWKCWWCGVQWDEGDPMFNCSHFYNRWKISTRFEEDNCNGVCQIPCHQKLEDPLMKESAYYYTKVREIGFDRMERLRLLSRHQGYRIDAEKIVKKYTKLLYDLEIERGTRIPL